MCDKRPVEQRDERINTQVKIWTLKINEMEKTGGERGDRRPATHWKRGVEEIEG